MSEENKRDFIKNSDNTVPEGADYDVFSENTAENTIVTENIKRDYLKAIFNDKMECLNKDIRMTRSEYISQYNKIKDSYEKERKLLKKFMIVHTVILVMSALIFILMFFAWENFTVDFHKAQTSGLFRTPEVRGFWAAAGFTGSIGWIIFYLGVAQFIFFGIGHLRKYIKLKRNEEFALRALEERKKEAMLLGQYDAEH